MDFVGPKWQDSRAESWLWKFHLASPETWRTFSVTPGDRQLCALSLLSVSESRRANCGLDWETAVLGNESRRSLPGI